MSFTYNNRNRLAAADVFAHTVNFGYDLTERRTAMADARSNKTNSIV